MRIASLHCQLFTFVSTTCIYNYIADPNGTHCPKITHHNSIQTIRESHLRPIFILIFIGVYLAFGRTNLEKVIHFGAITPGLLRWGQFNENVPNNHEVTFCCLLKHSFYECLLKKKEKKSTRWHRRRVKEYIKDLF